MKYLYLFLILITSSFNPFLYASSLKNAKQEAYITQCIITQVTYLDDEYEPEMILTLNNDFRLLSKCFYGIFYAGQIVGLQFEGESCFWLITYRPNGSESGRINFYALEENSHFYQAF